MAIPPSLRKDWQKAGKAIKHWESEENLKNNTEKAVTKNGEKSEMRETNGESGKTEKTGEKK